MLNLFGSDSQIKFNIKIADKDQLNKENSTLLQNKVINKPLKAGSKRTVQLIYIPGKCITLDEKVTHKSVNSVDLKLVFKNIKKIKKSLKNKFNQYNVKNYFVNKVIATFDSQFNLIFINNISKPGVTALLKTIKKITQPINIKDMFFSNILSEEVSQVVKKLINSRQTHIEYKTEEISIELNFSGSYEFKSFDLIFPSEYLTNGGLPKKLGSLTKILDEHESLTHIINLKKSRNQSRRLLRVQHDVEKMKSLYHEYSDPDIESEKDKVETLPPEITVNETNESILEKPQNKIENFPESPKNSHDTIESKTSMLMSKSINKLAFNRKQTFSHFKTTRAKYMDVDDARKTKEFGETYAMEFLPEEDVESEKDVTNNLNRSRTMKLANSASIQRKTTLSNVKNINVDLSDFQLEHAYKDVISAESLIPNSVLIDWNFDALKLNKIQKFAILYKIFKPYFILTKVSLPTFAAFLKKIEYLYNRNKNPFHNFDHGVMVCHAANLFMNRMKKFNVLLDDHLKFAFVLAALGHDLDHTGRNNTFEIATNSKLAMRYSDKSPLEFHHIYKLFKIINDKKTNLISEFTVETYKKMREFIIEIILATDMKYHFTHIDNFKIIVNEGSDFTNKEHLFSLAGLLIHSADLNAPAKETSIAMSWSKLVAEEFTAQYNEEISMELTPTPYFKDLDIEVNFYKSEVNFIKFIVKPLYLTVEEFLREKTEERIDTKTDDNNTEDIKFNINGTFHYDDGGLIEAIINQLGKNKSLYETKIEELTNENL